MANGRVVGVVVGWPPVGAVVVGPADAAVVVVELAGFPLPQAASMNPDAAIVSAAKLDRRTRTLRM